MFLLDVISASLLGVIKSLEHVFSSGIVTCSCLAIQSCCLLPQLSNWVNYNNCKTLRLFNSWRNPPTGRKHETGNILNSISYSRKTEVVWFFYLNNLKFPICCNERKKESGREGWGKEKNEERRDGGKTDRFTEKKSILSFHKPCNSFIHRNK